MPLIDVEDKRKPEDAGIKLHPDLLRELHDYSEFADGSSIHHITAGALRRLFNADKEFIEWRKSHPTRATEPPEGSRKNTGRRVVKVAAAS